MKFKPMLSRTFPIDEDKQVELEKWFARNIKTTPSVTALCRQPKADGIRCYITIDGAYTKEGNLFQTTGHIQDILRPVFKIFPKLVIDGELYNHDFKDDFNQIISLAKKQVPTKEEIELAVEHLQFHIFDFYDGSDMSFFNRWMYYKKFIGQLSENGGVVNLINTAFFDSNIESIKEELDMCIEQGYEGIMIRFPHDSPYEQKISKYIWKVKKFYDAEYEVLDIIEGTGKWMGAAKSVLYRVDGELTAKAGIKGNTAFCRYLLKNKEKYIGNPATIKYQNLTPRGVPRFGIAKHFYETKKRDM